MKNYLISWGLTNPKSMKRGYSSRKILSLFLLLFTFSLSFAQAPSHDPSTMIRNNDGRYWIFTTGDGVWCMSSSNANFTDWRAEPTPFAPGTWPGWIRNYVDGFSGFFWAPDVIKIGGTYFLYYSCAGNGAPAAIGVATASDLRGPWTDRGMVVAGNNAIDPAILYDNGRLWMTWGNWQSGIDMVELNPSTGKRANSSSYHLVSGQVEGPGLWRQNDYYYLFYQRGLCCNGVNSSYYMVVARSTSITGPYTEERVFLPNRSGNIIGPGHFGYGEGKLTYHYYDANDNGAAKLMTTTLGFRNGWPVAGVTGDDGSTIISDPNSSIINGTYAIVASHSGKALDVYDWGTSDGTNIAQWEYWGGATQEFNITPVDGIWHRITPTLAPSKALDIDGISSSNGANVHLWEYWGGQGQQFRFQGAGTGKWRIIARNSEKCVDVEGVSTDNGANVFQWDCISGAANQMFSLVNLKSAGATRQHMAGDLSVYPNPSTNGNISVSTILEAECDVEVSVYNSLGQEVFSKYLPGQSKGEFNYRLTLSDVSPGLHFINVKAGETILKDKLIIQ